MQDVLKKWTDALLDWLGATTQQHDDWDRWVAVALVLAFCGASLFKVAVGACGVVFLLELFL